MAFINPKTASLQSSYFNPTDIYVGSFSDLTVNTAVDNITVKVEIKSIGFSKNVDVKINDKSGYINFPQEIGDGVYIMEVTFNGITTKTTIFKGEKPIEVDEYHTFGDLTAVITYGDIRNVDGKLKFSHDWKCDRISGNGIASYDSKFYVFRPKNLFTSRTDLPEFINFSPFNTFDEKPMKIHVLPKQKKISNYEYMFQPATRIKIIYCNFNWEEQENYVYPDKIERVQLNKKYSNFIFQAVFDLN